MFEGGTSGIFRFVVLSIFDFAIIFHLKNYLLGDIIFSTTSRVTHCSNTMDLKSQKKHKIQVEKFRFFFTVKTTNMFNKPFFITYNANINCL